MLKLEQRVSVAMPGRSVEMAGRVIGRIYTCPPRYDVMLDGGEIANNLPEEAVCAIVVEEVIHGKSRRS